jgi:translation initiation factor IF-2
LSENGRIPANSGPSISKHYSNDGPSKSTDQSAFGRSRFVGSRSTAQERPGFNKNSFTPAVQFEPIEISDTTWTNYPKTSTIPINNELYDGAIPPPPMEYATEQSNLRRAQAEYEKEQRRRQKFGDTSAPKPQQDRKLRGKDKDKARRRDQFIAKYEEASKEELEAEARAEQKRLKRLEDRKLRNDGPWPIKLPDFITVNQLAQALHITPNDFSYKMSELGFENWSYDLVLSSETAGLIAMEYNYEPVAMSMEVQDLKALPPPEDISSLPSRPPVVTIMGHVDHGKTTLLDWLRKSSVAASEHGGITQHIGAFSVPMPSGRIITFLDTPGHAAFLNMRQRGATVTDIVILVVAADDSVKPQTIEAIKHARGANVPIIVAINKIDKPDSAPEKVKQDLARHNVEVEDFGGDTQTVLVSGKTGQGMSELEESILALADIIDMRAPKVDPPEGWILEATTKPEGRVATVLVRRGTLRLGDVLVAGSTWARVRRLRNEAGVDVDEALPGTPIEVDGWRDQPTAGDEVLATPDEGRAKEVVEFRLDRAERLKLTLDVEAINTARRLDQEKRNREKEEQQAIKDGITPITSGAPEHVESIALVNFIVKGDVSGSVEAVEASISSVGNNEAQAQVLRAGVGAVSEFDVEHAAAAGGTVVSFNMAVEPHIRRFAEQASVSILDYNIIYRLVDEVKAVVSEKLPPLTSTRVLGEAEIAQVFKINVRSRIFKPVAGVKIRNGVVARNKKVKVLRDGEVVFDGMSFSLISLLPRSCSPWT